MRAPDELRTVGDFIRWSASRFNAAGLHFGHGTDNAMDEARSLVLSTLSLPFDVPDYFVAGALTADEAGRVARVIERRIRERIPAPYLTGTAWFMGLPIAVDERVIIPRSPLAELIESGFEPWIDPARVRRVLDLCTGSGCIAIACAQVFPDALIDAVDNDRGALEVAEANVARHHAHDRVRLVESDLFDALPAASYDVIVANPPYVSADEMNTLPPEYAHEPRSALAAGADGLDVVRRILAQAGDYLAPDGVLIGEVGNSAPALETAFPGIAFVWPEFVRGGHGVFVVGASQLAGSVSRSGEAAGVR